MPAPSPLGRTLEDLVLPRTSDANNELIITPIGKKNKKYFDEGMPWVKKKIVSPRLSTGSKGQETESSVSIEEAKDEVDPI